MIIQTSKNVHVKKNSNNNSGHAPSTVTVPQPSPPPHDQRNMTEVSQDETTENKVYVNVKLDQGQ